MTDAQTLLDLQAADLAILRAKRKLDELPEKGMIIEIKEKRKEVCKRRAQVIDIADDLDQHMAKLRNEDAVLTDHIAAAQSKLDTTKDYRLISGITKEMEGYVKRREKVSFELGNLKDRVARTSEIKHKADEAVNILDSREQKAIDSYRRNGGAIQAEIGEAVSRRDAAAARLAPALLERYTKLAARKGGIAVGQLQGRMCSVCHVEYQEGQLLQIGKEGAIATCPNCNRMLIVDVHD